MQITEFDPLKKATATYSLDRGAPKFDIIETKSKKDQHYNLAVQQAQKEFENLKQIADVINKQAQQIKERLEITELVYNAERSFTPVVGATYWIIKDTKKDNIQIVVLGPKDWSHGTPSNYEYLQEIKYLANGLWEKVEDN
jgi:hypothetical protein